MDLFRTWLGVAAISFSAIYVRLADVEPARAALLRGAYALPAFAVVIAVRHSRARRSGLPPHHGDRRAVLLALAGGLFLGVDLVAWHASIEIMGAGLATVIPNLQVLFVGLIGIALFHERPRRPFWFALPVVLAGVWLLSSAGSAIETDGSVPLGIGLGLVAGLAYSGFLVMVRLARLRGIGAVEVMGAATLGVTISAFVPASIEGVAGVPPTLEANLWLLALALGSQFGGWWLLTSSINKLPAAVTSVALLMQPVLTLLWGVTLLGETIGPVQVGGAMTVLIGVAIAHRATVTATVVAQPIEA